MEYVILLLLSILPSLVLGFIIYKKDKVEKEPVYLLVRLVLGGILAIFLTLVISAFIPIGLENFANINLFTSFLYVFATIGLIEEFSKWVFLRAFTWNSKEFDHIYDAVVYAVFIALGFATFENILYVFTAYFREASFQTGLQTGIYRCFLSVPGHAFFGAYMGYYYGLAKQAMLLGKTKLYEKNIRRSILVPAVIHGIFDVLLMYETDVIPNLLLYLFFIFVIVLYIFAFRRILQFSDIKVNMVTLNKKTYNNPLFDKKIVPNTNQNTVVSKVCPNCYYPNKNEHNYCIRCGYKL